MNRERAVLAATVGIILAVTVVSGPLVGVSLTSEQSFDPGSGSVDATVVSAPDTATLKQGSHGAGVYYLRADPVDLEVTNVSGQPSIIYELYLPEQGYTASSLTFIDDEATGEVAVEFDPVTMEADRVDADAYDAVLRVLVNDDRGERPVLERDVTVEVVG